MSGDILKHSLATIISEFETEESDAPFIFNIESRNRGRDCLVIVRIREHRKRNYFMKSAFIVKSQLHLNVFRDYLKFLSSNTFQQNFKQ